MPPKTNPTSKKLPSCARKPTSKAKAMKEATVTRGIGRFILLHVTNFLVDHGAELSAKNVGEKPDGQSTC